MFLVHNFFFLYLIILMFGVFEYNKTYHKNETYYYYYYYKVNFIILTFYING